MANGPVFEAFGEARARRNDALERVAELERERHRIAGLQAVALVEAHDEFFGIRSRSVQAAADRMLGERSFRAEVAALLTISERAADNLIGVARALTASFPRTLDAVTRGEISWRHATIMVDELSELDEAAQERLETRLLEKAAMLTPPKFARLARLTRERANPETIVQRHVAAIETRGVSVVDQRDGMSDLIIHARSIDVHAIHDRLTSAATGIAGRDEERTLDQRRADIVTHVLLAQNSAEIFGVVPDEFDDVSFIKWFRGIKPEVIVSVPVLTLAGVSNVPATLNGRVPVDPDTAKALVGTSKSFTRILTHPETGVVLSVGRRKYKTPKDLRRYLQIRDRLCRFPGCSMPAERSEIDHTHEWQYGGETDSTNLGCFCPGHHTLKSSGRWTATQDGASVYTWTSETGRIYPTYPQGTLFA